MCLHKIWRTDWNWRPGHSFTFSCHFWQIIDSSRRHFIFLFNSYNLVIIAYIRQKLKVTYRKYFYCHILHSRKSKIVDYWHCKSINPREAANNYCDMTMKCGAKYINMFDFIVVNHNVRWTETFNLLLFRAATKQQIFILTRKPCCRKETARCRSCFFRFNVRRQHSLQV